MIYSVHCLKSLPSILRLDSKKTFVGCQRHLYAIVIMLGLIAVSGCDDNNDESIARGKIVYASHQCATCHGKPDAQLVGPSLHGIADRPVTLQNGKSVLRDEAYLIRAIVDPKADMVAGYGPTMQPYAEELAEYDLRAIVAFIQSLPDSP